MNADCIMLNNGVTMPKIGYGVFRMTGNAACEEAVVQAINSGHRRRQSYAGSLGRFSVLEHGQACR